MNNRSVARGPFPDKDPFTISEYLHFLTPNGKEKGKYICPVCEGDNLSVHKDGKKYNCFSGCEPKKIAYRLREMNGEFKGKVISPSGTNSIDLLQVYKPDKSSLNVNGKNDNSGEPEKLNDNVKALKYIGQVWGDGLRFNLRTLEVELYGKSIEPDGLHVILAEDHNKLISKDRTLDIVYHLARKNEYDPFLNYLESCRAKYLNPQLSTETLAHGFFRLSDPYYNALLRLFLVAVVKRAYEPGCKWDMALVLQGDQGLGKSTFFRVLANNFFSDCMGADLGTNDLRILHEHAINEWGELDGFTAKTFNSTIKAFLSRQEDQFRLPYARAMLKMKRRSVIVGTTNEKQFLTDMTGNRRFGVIPVEWIIPPDELEVLRDELWAAAIVDYMENWRGPHNVLELPPEYRQRQAAENETFLVGDLLEDAIAAYLEDQTVHVTMVEVIRAIQDWQNGALEHIRPTDRSIQMRVAKIMGRLGWVKRHKRFGDKTCKVWVRGDLNF